MVRPGDRIRFRVKSLPGCSLVVNENIPLFEQPVGPSIPIPGIFQGEYVISASDSFNLSRLAVTATDRSGKAVMKRMEGKISDA